jgi:hypothetical protein
MLRRRVDADGSLVDILFKSEDLFLLRKLVVKGPVVFLAINCDNCPQKYRNATIIVFEHKINLFNLEI